MHDSGGPNILYPLTHPQKRIWYIEKFYPGTSLYNIGGPSRIKGEVDFKLLEEAINLFIKRNDGIRLHIVEQNGEALQYVSEYRRTRIDFFDFSAAKDPEREFNAWAQAEMMRPFQLIDSDLYYFALFKTDAANTGIFAKFHHIIADGWSINVGAEQIYGVYDKLLRGEEPSGESENSYIEYLESEQHYLNSERFFKNRAFWTEKFMDIPEPIFRDNPEQIAGRRITYSLENTLSRKIKEFTTGNKYSLNTFFVALFLIYLHKVSGREDIVIGTPVLNRSGKKERSIFGMFTSTMPFRFRFDATQTVGRMMEEVNEELLKFFFHQKYPYDLLVQDIELKKKGYDNLFQVSVNYYNTKLDQTVNGHEIETTEYYNGNQLYALQMVIKDWDRLGNLTVEFDYKLSEYTEGQINLLFRCLLNIINQILSDSTNKISSLDVLPEDERIRQIYGFNATECDYPRDKTICQLFEEQVERTPEKIAVSFANDQLTYRELNQKSNQLARILRDKGVTRDTIVGLMVTHSIEAVVGILGIIKAGGAYLPIDPEYPAERIEYMLGDSGCGIVLTNCISKDSAPLQTFLDKREVIFLDYKELYLGESANPAPVNALNDLVYVIYTSGSTGNPKGVMIEHRGLVNYIWWAKKMYVQDENDSFALYSSLSFDLTVTSVFTPLIGGNTIYVYRDDGPEYVLFKIMRENKVSIVKLTPSHLSLLKEMDNRHSSVRCFIVGGEDLKVSLAASIHESFGGNITIYNEYGPTETVVGCMIHKYDPDNDKGVSVPIGIPAENVQIYILDKELHPLPEGSIGEMYISGDGVARGYLNRSDLTRERFIENPFIKGKRMYKTGDLAKFLDNGKIEYAGRSDHQVKIRGYRIELGEIERHLQNHHLIEDAVVIDRQNANGEKHLCAYITTYSDSEGENEPARGISGKDVIEFKKFLSKQLPEYMIPSHFIVLPEIPLTPNGKVDRNKLPVPEEQAYGAGEFVAPRNDKEEKLARIVSQVLNRPEVSVKDNFFYLGGDSIKAIQIAGKLNEMGLKTRVRDLLAHPVIEEMAFCLEYGDINNIDQNPCAGTFKPTPVISWFLEQNFKNINHYNQSVLLDFKGEISKDELGLILDELVKHHDSLRLNYNRITGELYYNNDSLEKADTHINACGVEFYDLSGDSPAEQERKISQFGYALKSSLNIEHGIPIKACIFNLGGRGRMVLLTAHHLAVDGVSWRIMLEDFVSVYNQIRGGKPVVLPSKTHSMREWAHRLEDYAREYVFKSGTEKGEEIGFWKRILENDFVFPVDFESGEATNATCITVTSCLEEAETRKLLSNANEAYGTRADELMITALVLTICDFAKSNEAVIELEGHGREELFKDIDISRTVGWFTSIYPVVLSIASNKAFEKKEMDLGERIKAVKEQLRRIPQKGLGYGILKYYTDELNNGCLTRAGKHIRFNFLGGLEDLEQNELFEIAAEDSGGESSNENHPTALIDINVIISNKKLKINLTYSKNQFKDGTINDFLQRFTDNLKEIIDFCVKRKSAEFTPSDFGMVNLSQDDLDSLLS